jgi:hypothetical protein
VELLHSPCPLQSSRHGRRSHPAPCQGAEQAHTPVSLSHDPWPEQSPGQSFRRTPQSLPVKKGRHAHFPFTHWPPLRHFSKQKAVAQSTPEKPARQKQAPSLHTPWPLQSAGQGAFSTTSQDLPEKPVLHTHVPSGLHAPREEQLRGHAMFSHAFPVNPAEQMQYPISEHFPRLAHSFPEASSGQKVGGEGKGTVLEQSLPPKPAKQEHFSDSQTPFPLQRLGQTDSGSSFSEQSSPVKPLEHKQVPFLHQPC